jgi:hypothetical protein
MKTVISVYNVRFVWGKKYRLFRKYRYNGQSIRLLISGKYILSRVLSARGNNKRGFSGFN